MNNENNVEVAKFCTPIMRREIEGSK